MLNTKRTVWGKYYKYRYLLALFIPGLAYLLIFKYGPILGLQIAFKDYLLRQGMWASPFVGLKHFIRLFGLGSFWEVFRNTLVISLYNMVFGFPAPILLAILINEIYHLGYKKIVQTVSYLPHFVSWVVLGGIFIQFFSATGPINQILVNFDRKPILFMYNPSWFRFILVSTNIWKSIGWGSIVYLAALSNIGPELYEAADIDGATRIQKISYITIPSLTPVITIMLIFQVGRLINDHFDQVFNLYNPAVYQVGDVISTYTFRMGIEKLQYSFATAVGLFKNIISFTLVLSANAIARRLNDYALW